MTYRVPLPPGGRASTVDLIDGTSTSVQRYVRRHGLGAYETSTSAAMLALGELARPDFILFDIGCNMGLYSALLASMFRPGPVHAFEPSPSTAEIAKRVALANKLPIEIHQLALSDRDGFADLYLSPVSDSSNSLVEGFRDTSETVEVPTLTLDSFSEASGATPDIIKLDVETHERAVLDGGRRTIERSRPAIVVEVLRRRGRDHGDEITEFFDGLGYFYYELPAVPDWQPRDVIRGNGTADRDWLLVPAPLPDSFPAQWDEWHDRLVACDESQNPRTPLSSRALGAYRRGGLAEVWTAVRTRLRT